jgi:hypothetical protein
MFFVRPEIMIVDVEKVTQIHGSDAMDFYKTHKQILHQIFYFTQKAKRIELGNATDTNPYHLFFFMLARFYYVDDGSTDILFYYPKCEDIDHVYVNSAFLLLPSRFKRETLKDDTLEYVELPGCLWYDHTINEPWIYDYVRNLFKDVWSSTRQQKGKYTYVVRDPVLTKCRRILNHNEFIDAAKKEDFSVYEMSNLTFVEQILLFRSSEFILGVHGAALAFLVFCEPGTQVLELYPNNLNKGYYHDLSKRAGLQYSSFIGFDSFNAENEDMSVNISIFHSVIQHLKRQMV